MKNALDPGQLDAAVAAVFKEVVAAIRKVRGEADAEAALWKRAAAEVTELRAAAGEPAPAERLGHIFGLEGWGKAEAPFETLGRTEEEFDRWADALEV